MTLAELYTPQDHLRMIGRYNRILTGKNSGQMKTALTFETIVRKLEYHVTQYTIKTGQLPE